MYKKKAHGYVIKHDEKEDAKTILERILDLFLDENVHFLNWVAIQDEKLCVDCAKMSGKVYDRDELIFPFPPLHLFCRCSIQPITTVEAGKVTNLGIAGADWWLKNEKKLPDYYITYEQALELGYIPNEGNLDIVTPDRVLTRGQFDNRNGHLPEKPDRIWYEADINYEGGYRNNERIVYSNDGLLFVTLDHYKTYIEII